MADFLISKITIQSNTGAYIAGDIIKTYWDDSASEIIVHKNDVLVTSGDNLTVNSTISVFNYNYSYCTGTDLYSYITLAIFSNVLSFPYSQEIFIPNHSSCQTTPVACDIFLQLTSKVLPTTATSTDGEIVVSATTSRASVEYSLSNFKIGDGQASGTFTGLSKGTYTVYAADTNNCLAFKTIVLNSQQDYSTIYRMEWDDIQGNTNRFDIEEQDYSGSITEIDSGSNPLVYTVNSTGSDVNFYESTIKSSLITVQLVSPTDFLYRNLYTQNDRKYRGIWYLNIGAGLTEKWRGFLLPSIFTESYTYTPYITSLTFTDGLEDLADKEYLEDGEIVRGEDEIIKIINRILEKTGILLPVRIGVNIYSSSMTTTATSDPFKQAYMDNATFYRGDEENEPMESYLILNEILKDFGAIIYQSAGYWWITRPEEMRASSFDYREYDVNSDYSSNGSHSTNINIAGASSSTRGVFLRDSVTYSVKPSFGSITIENELNILALIKNGNFRYWTQYENGSIFFDGWTFVSNDSDVSSIQGELNGNSFAGVYNINSIGNARDAYYTSVSYPITVSSADSIRFSFDHSFDSISTILSFLVLKYQVKLTLSGTDYYLKEDKTWTTTEYVARFTPAPSNDFSTNSIESPCPDGLFGAITGTFQIRVYNYYSVITDYGSKFDDQETEFRAADTTVMVIGHKTDTIFSVGGVWWHHFYSLENDSDEWNVSTPEDYPNIVLPDDYNSSTNKRLWQLVGRIRVQELVPVAGVIDIPFNQYYYIDNVELLVLPNGSEPPTKETITLQIDDNINEKLKVNLSFADVGQFADDSRVINDTEIYNDYYRLSDGSAITDWSRDSESESLTIQKILIKTLGSQFKTPTNKLSGSLTTDEGASGTTYIFPNNVLVETGDGNKIYYIDGMTFNSKMNDYSMELIELKEIDEGGGASAFNGDFNADFGNSFDTIYN